MYNKTFTAWHKDLCGFGAFLKCSYILANLSWDVLAQNHQTPSSVVLKGVVSSKSVAWVHAAALSGFVLVSFWLLKPSVHLVTRALGNSSTFELLSVLCWIQWHIATVVLSSLGVWGFTKHSAGSSEAMGSTIAVTIFRCLSCLGVIPCLPGKGFLSPCVSSHGSWFGLCAWPEQQLWCDGPDLGWAVGTECFPASTPRQHDFHTLLSPFPFPVPFSLLAYFPISCPVFSFSCFLSWSQFCCIYTQIWHFWCIT